MQKFFRCVFVFWKQSFTESDAGDLQNAEIIAYLALVTEFLKSARKFSGLLNGFKADVSEATFYASCLLGDGHGNLP